LREATTEERNEARRGLIGEAFEEVGDGRAGADFDGLLGAAGEFLEFAEK